jgi:hypothetical protein
MDCRAVELDLDGLAATLHVPDPPVGDRAPDRSGALGLANAAPEDAYPGDPAAPESAPGDSANRFDFG